MERVRSGDLFVLCSPPQAGKTQIKLCALDTPAEMGGERRETA